MELCRYRTHLNYGIGDFWHMESTEVLCAKLSEDDRFIDANGSSVVTIPDHPVTKAFIEQAFQH